MAEMLNTALEFKRLVDLMTDEEKKQALALLQGMLIGKELAADRKETA